MVVAHAGGMRSIAPLLAAILLPLASCSGTVTGRESVEPVELAPPPPGVVQISPASLPFLEIETLERRNGITRVRVPARVAFRDGAVSALNAPIEGRVTQVHVKVGDRVRAGQPLVTLHSPGAAAARAELAKALVTERAARLAVERHARMVEQGIGIEVERLAAEHALAEAEAEAARARKAVAYLGGGEGSVVVLRSPVAGTVTGRRVTPGVSVEPGGEPLLEVGDPAALWIVADVFERDLPLVREGARATVELPGIEAPAAGRIALVGASLDASLRAAPVYIELEDRDLPLRPGMFARAGIEAEELEGISLPVKAVLVKEGRRQVVYVAQDEVTFAARDVAVGRRLDGRIQILSGLEPGDRVVVKGALLLDGSADQLL
jgi:membrane fusion protein, heavy metal efflux system